MTLIDEREMLFEQEKKRKIFKAIIIAIIVLVILAVILWVYVSTKNSKKLKIYVDGEEKAQVEDTLVLKNDKGKVLENNGQIYISVRDLSTLLNCQYYNSEYKKKGEDKTKCQVRNENEYTSYISDSNNMYKAIVTKPDATDNKNVNNKNTESENLPDKVDYEYFTLNDSVKYINDTIYANIDAIELGLNVSITYDSKKNTISIYSLNQLEVAANNVRSDVVPSTEYSYANKRLLKYGMCIVKDSQGNFGVGSYTDQNKISSYVASCKYSSIEFDEAKQILTVITSNDNKKCILSLDLDKQEVTKNITSQYDDIQAIDNNFQYFVVKSEEKFGIIDSNGKIILYPLFDEIGIDDGLYTDVFGKYILNNKYIPIKQNGLWGLYNINGNKLIDPQFQDFGCALAQSGDSVTIIPNIRENVDGVVFLYNKEKSLYGVYNAETGEKIAISLIEAFKKVENGEDNYYLNHVIDRNNAVVHTLNVYTDL